MWLEHHQQALLGDVCSGPSTVTPEIYSQLVTAANVSYALHHYAPPCSTSRTTSLCVTPSAPSPCSTTRPWSVTSASCPWGWRSLLCPRTSPDALCGPPPKKGGGVRAAVRVQSHTRRLLPLSDRQTWDAWVQFFTSIYGYRKTNKAPWLITGISIV